MFLYVKFFLAFVFLTLIIKFLTRNSTHKLTWTQLILVLSLKVALGCFYGWLFLTYYGGDDTWEIHQDTLNEWDNLINQPFKQFFIYEVDIRKYISDMGLKDGLSYFRMKFEKALINKPLGIFNFYSGGNYYINVIAFNFFSFWGFYWLYRTVCKILPEYKQLSFLLLFLYPPAIFWLSGIRSDALLFTFFSLFVSRLYDLKNGNIGKWNWIWVFLAWSGMIVVKASFALLLVVPAAAYWLTGTVKRSHAFVFLTTFGLAALLFFTTALLPEPFNLPKGVRKVQSEFFELKGNTRVDLPALETSVYSYVRNLPAALDNIFLRPYPWEAKGPLQLVMVAQNIFLICLVALLIVRSFPGKQQLLPHAFFWLLFSFAISFYLSIGYTVPFPGAVIRYRVIPETLMVWLLAIGILGGGKSHYNFFYVYKNRGIS